MEDTQSQQIKTGVFVAIGLLGIFLSIVFLGEERVSFSGTYRLLVQFKNISGLNTGSQVTLSGLRIGTVTDINFATGTQDLVLGLEIDRRYQKRITEGSLATVKTLGALGDKYIHIVPGPIDAKPIEPDSLLAADTSEDLIDVLARRGNELGAVVEMVNELNSLLKNLNQDGKSRLLMDNLISTSGQLKSLVAEARESLNKDKLRDSVNHLNSVLAKIDQGRGTLGALINDSGLHDRLSKMLGEPPRKQFLKPLIRETILHRERSAKEAK